MTGKIKIITTLSLSIALLIVICFYTYRKTQDYKLATDWANHTQEVIPKVYK